MYKSHVTLRAFIVYGGDQTSQNRFTGFLERNSGISAVFAESPRPLLMARFICLKYNAHLRTAYVRDKALMGVMGVGEIGPMSTRGDFLRRSKSMPHFRVIGITPVAR